MNAMSTPEPQPAAEVPSAVQAFWAERGVFLVAGPEPEPEPEAGL
jgi:hypothetical protein